MEHVLIKDNHLRDLLKKGDLAIFDRGFLDCISRLKSAYGMKNGQKQLSWSEASETRLSDYLVGDQKKFNEENINEEKIFSLKKSKRGTLNPLQKPRVYLLGTPLDASRHSDTDNTVYISEQVKSLG
ncbi:hypothetical protein BpHYR1_034029 [Brachionus plicatilis]|uniref:Uncharacterized protein n=1 Tax=Brachionus plicatilis TaxID=10195 RepID=A0A3M7PFM1_BRAPC|nr:hypothetical protein BpHYR1_034029 [Brachionus plicatilis]